MHLASDENKVGRVFRNVLKLVQFPFNVKGIQQRLILLPGDKSVSLSILNASVLERKIGTVRSLANGDDIELAAWSAPGASNVVNRLMLEETEE